MPFLGYAMAGTKKGHPVSPSEATSLPWYFCLLLLLYSLTKPEDLLRTLTLFGLERRKAGQSESKTGVDVVPGRPGKGACDGEAGFRTAGFHLPGTAVE